MTAKFVLEVTEDAERDRHLTVTVELAPGLHDSDETAQAIGRSILTQLRRLKSNKPCATCNNACNRPWATSSCHRVLVRRSG